MGGWGFILMEIFVGEAGRVCADDPNAYKYVKESLIILRFMAAIVHHVYTREPGHRTTAPLSSEEPLPPGAQGEAETSTPAPNGRGPAGAAAYAGLWPPGRA